MAFYEKHLLNDCSMMKIQTFIRNDTTVKIKTLGVEKNMHITSAKNKKTKIVFMIFDHLLKVYNYKLILRLNCIRETLQRSQRRIVS